LGFAIINLTFLKGELNMCVDIVTTEGKHMGVVIGRFQKKFLATVTDAKAEEIFNGLDYIKDVAGVTECLTMFKKINEDKLDDIMRKWWQEQGLDAYSFGMEKALRLYIVKNSYNSTYNVLNKITLPEDFKALKFFLAEGSRWSGESIVLADGYDVPDLDWELDFSVLVGRISSPPRIDVDIMGALGSLMLGGGLSDMGGNNHIHTTTLKISSGDTEVKFELPLLIYARKNDVVAIELSGKSYKVGRQIYAGGVFFTVA
jgi:hypothetical protein